MGNKQQSFTKTLSYDRSCPHSGVGLIQRTQ
ncbi:hypothetical protein PsyrH_12845 [Pseudomonas syringae pv. syringae HS191]|nr:hypothetical protein PsyrH_12845 [Pseudomonas syringae pv. syringae HS191]